MISRGLKRSLVESGELIRLLEAAGQQTLSAADRFASLRSILDSRPKGDLWLFAYGSLMWNPMIQTLESRTAQVEGWHRSFCLSVTAGRGTPQSPGLLLALEEGGSCTGIAYRIAQSDICSELGIVWAREMVAPAYMPVWVDLLDSGGRTFARAITFTMDKSSGRYVTGLSREATAQRLVKARGPLGSCADYLLRTRDSLRQIGVVDTELEALGDQVESLQHE